MVRLLRLLLPLCLCPALSAEGELSIAGVFSDHAVLQRGVPLPVWGTATPGAAIEVAFAGEPKSATAKEDGSWELTLAPQKASSEGRTLVIRSKEHEITFRDLVVGEVWLASGQSNMQFSMSACARNLAEVKAAIDDKNTLPIRMLRIGNPDSESVTPIERSKARWVLDSPQSRPGQSAVAYFFARRLAAELKVPIGVIETSWGGKPIEGFIPAEQFKRFEELKPILTLSQENKLEELKELKGGVIIRNSAGRPGRIFNGRLAAVAPYAVAGAIWYQGESNAGNGEDPRNYRLKMRALIDGWRSAWRAPKMPFYFVQLPAFRDDAYGWVRLREEQRLSLEIPHTGMAVTIDLRDNDIHPANKIDVGERLARWPLANQYGRTQLAASGPLFKSASIEGSTVRVSFHHLGGQLIVARKEGLAPPEETPATALAHFELAGADGVWHAARAEIEGQEVVVRSEAVPAPIAVRYGCRGAPENANLYNRSGLPASPFSSRLDLLPWAPPQSN